MGIREIGVKYTSLPVQIKASFWFLICSFLQKGISMITTPIFTRLLTTEEYGKYSVFNSWLSIITIIVSLNLYAGVHAQGLVKFSDDRNTFTSSLQGLTTALVLAWTGVYLVFQSFWNGLFHLSTVQILAMLLMIWTTSVFSFWANEQRVRYSYKSLILLTLFISFAKPVLGIILVIKSDDKVTARILGLALVELLGYSWLFIYHIKRGKHLFSKSYWLYALRFNLPLVPHYLSQVVLNGADRIMIEKMIGESETGIYSLAYSISQIMLLFNTALSQTITPWMYQKIKDHKESDIAPIAYISLIIIALANLFLITLAPEVVSLFAPSEYYDAIWVIPPVAMSVFFMFCYNLFATFAFYYEKTKYIMMASVIGAVLNLVLNYICIGMFGYIAAGYTTLICYIIFSITNYCFLKKVCRKYGNGTCPYYTPVILAITILFVFGGIILQVTYRRPAIRYSIVGIALVTIVIFRNKIFNKIGEIFNAYKRK